LNFGSRAGLFEARHTILLRALLKNGKLDSREQTLADALSSKSKSEGDTLHNNPHPTTRKAL